MSLAARIAAKKPKKSSKRKSIELDQEDDEDDAFVPTSRYTKKKKAAIGVLNYPIVRD